MQLLEPNWILQLLMQTVSNLFDSLLAGNFKVQFIAPSGSLLVTKTAGSDPTKDSNPDTSTGITDAVTIDTTQPIGSVARDNMTLDAGIVPQKQYGLFGRLCMDGYKQQRAARRN